MQHTPATPHHHCYPPVPQLFYLFFFPLGTPNQNLKLNALQFAAKLHEVTIVASLSIVAIHCVQYELLRGKGLSLGGVLAGFQVTDLISLWSPGLWNRCLTPGFRTHRIRFVLLIILSHNDDCHHWSLFSNLDVALHRLVGCPCLTHTVYTTRAQSSRPARAKARSKVLPPGQ
ncbi:hypothetical protein N431DRAFT_524226, partial [Stipitochalara longipes BDJ]